MRSNVIFRRRTFVFLILFTFSIHLSAQFQLLLDPINGIKTTSLFNLSLVNNTASSGQVALTATLRTKRGKVLMKQTTSASITPNSIQQIRGNQNLQTTFLDASFQKMYQKSQTLPPLNYVLCITANGMSDQKIKANECIEYMATDFVTIMPLYPSEEIEIYDQRPLFSWMDLLPEAAYTYNFRLVALEKGQNPQAALRRNSPIISKDNLKEKQLLFPSDAPALKDQEIYVWQLAINYQGEQLMTTDAWEFTYKEQEQYIDFPKDLSYVDITEIERGANLYAVGEFKFKYPSDISNELEAELFELKKEKRKKVELTNKTFPVKLGVNKFELDLKEQVYLKHLKDYLLVLKDQKTNQSFQFTVKYINPDYIK